jgi:hypothetical protein
MWKEAHNVLGTSASEIKQAIFRLAHFDPTCRDEYGNQVIDYLVLDSLATFGRLTVTALEIGENIKRCYRLDFEEPEINVSGKRLGQKGTIVYEEGARSERPTFQILPEIEQRIANNLAQIQELENGVIQDWKEELCNKYEEFPVVKDNVERIVESLQLFVSRMLTRHGVQCVALLYPEDQKTQRWLESIESSILEGSPTIDSFTDAIAKLEIPSFFKNPDSKRKVYITSLFNSSFFLHLVQVDEKCSKLLREVTKGQRLYLDNNILYSLVGLDGAIMLQSVHSMLKLAGTLGYELWVTTKSVDEFHDSLNWQMKELKRKPPLPSELARIAVENLDVNSFLTLYWRDFVRNGTSIEEFVTEKSHLEDILQGLNIRTTNKHRKDIERSQDLLNEESILRSVCRSELGEHIIEHDAFHRVFINKIRRGPKYHFPEAVAWFLTHDSKLPAYDRVARKGKNHLSFCITSDQWVQVNRPLLTRTANQEEYEESFHVLVTQPFLRTMMSTLSLEKAYNEVLGRLARYKNMNPQLALNIVTNKHFMVTMASETDEEKIEEEIENKFIDIATQLQSEKETLEKDIQSDRERIQRLEKKFSSIERKVQETETRETRYRKQVEELQKSLEDEKTATEKEKEKLEAFKTNLVRWAIFVGGLGLTSLPLWLHQWWLDWPWLDTHKNRILIELATQLLLVFGLLNIPLRRFWKTWLTCLVAIAVTILTLACS